MRWLLVLSALVACADGPDRARVVVADAGAADAAPPVVTDAGPACGCADGETCIGAECTKLTLGFKRMFPGDADRGEHQLGYAWQQFGANLDQISSSYMPQGECKPPKEAPYPPSDAPNGIDNVWGQKVLPLLQQRWDPTPTKTLDDFIAGGGRAPVVGLGRIQGVLGTTKMRALLTYVERGNAEPTAVVYPNATFANGTFDSGPADVIVTLSMLIGQEAIALPVQRLHVHFELLPDNTTTAGVLSGAIAVADLQNAIAAHVGRTDPTECTGTRIADMKRSIALAVDVLSDGAVDPTRECDAISFGIGFDAGPIAVSGTKAAPAPAATACP